MLRELVQQQFPGVTVRGVADRENTGNFVVRTEDGVVMSPYGFLGTSARQRALLEAVAAL